MVAKKYRFTEQDDGLIRSRYDSRSETIDELVRAFRMPRWAVRRRAEVLGVARTQEARWSSKDEVFLAAQVTRLSIATLALKLGRSRTAVALKMKRLGIRKGKDGYTQQSLSLAFGVDNHTVARWVKSGMLRATLRHTEREYDVYLITDEAVRDFIQRYPLGFDLRKVDQLWFMDLLLDGRIGENDDSEKRRD